MSSLGSYMYDLGMPFHHVCGCLLLPFLITKVMAQDAFPVVLTVSPINEVPLSTIVNLTCTFRSYKENFLRVRLLENDKLVVHDFPGSPSDKWPRIVSNGTLISENPEVDSVIWVTIKAHHCNSQSGSQTYKCLPFNRLYEYGTDTKNLTYAEPYQNLYINGTEVLPNKTHKLESDAAESQHMLTFVTSDERSPVIGLSLTIGDKTITSFTNKSKLDVCAFGAQLEQVHQFSAGKEHVVNYTVKTTNHETNGMFKISVEGTKSTASPEKLSWVVLAVGTSTLAAAAVVILLLVRKQFHKCKAQEKARHESESGLLTSRISAENARNSSKKRMGHHQDNGCDIRNGVNETLKVPAESQVIF